MKVNLTAYCAACDYPETLIINLEEVIALRAVDAATFANTNMHLCRHPLTGERILLCQSCNVKFNVVKEKHSVEFHDFFRKEP